MYSDMENIVLEKLRKEFGSMHESMNEQDVTVKVENSKALYEQATDDYRLNQSAKNYNVLILAMISLQYWNQKRTRFFSVTEEF